LDWFCRRVSGDGLSGVRYHPREIAMVLGGLLLLMLLGMWR